MTDEIDMGPDSLDIIQVEQPRRAIWLCNCLLTKGSDLEIVTRFTQARTREQVLAGLHARLELDFPEHQTISVNVQDITDTMRELLQECDE